MARALVLFVSLCAIILSGCYRVEAPPNTGLSASIRVGENRSHLPRIQQAMHHALAESLRLDGAWVITPNGAVDIVLHFDEEDIESTNTNQRDIPKRWRITVTGTALIRYGERVWEQPFSGSGNAGDLESEDRALEQAARNVANRLRAWLVRTLERAAQPPE